MGDRNLGELLKWSLANSAPTMNKTSATTSAKVKEVPSPQQEPQQPSQQQRDPKPEALAALFGGPSDAELMQSAMAAITSPNLSLEDKLTAFDNLEQLIESVDNANQLSQLGLFTPLLGQLFDRGAPPEMRTMAAWCVGTAVQNNPPCQERLLAADGLERLVAMALDEDGEAVETRKKVIYALSSAVRNYQPAMNVVLGELKVHAPLLIGEEKELVAAGDMIAVDWVMGKLREKVLEKALEKAK